MLHTKFHGNWPTDSGEEDVWRVLAIYGRGGHLRHAKCGEQTFIPPTHWRSTQSLALIDQAVSGNKMFEDCGRRRTDHWYTIS